MLAAFLTFFGLAGGAAVTFFTMDAPRRRAKLLRAELEERIEIVRNEREINDERSRRLAAQIRAVRDDEAALTRRESKFEQRVITYDDLAAENRLVKVELRNMALLVAQREQQVFETEHLRTTLANQRDLLGHAYLEEVRAYTRKALTANNYAASKRRMADAIQRLAAAGVRPTDAGQRQIKNELHQLYEAAVRAAVEREEQARIKEQIREDQRMEREAQTAAEQAEQKRKAIENALEQALGAASEQHVAEIDRLRAQLAEAKAEAEAKSVRAIALAQITRAGNVYVISNIGSFGRDVFKIGMTRRREPMDRVYELGDASVPFPFDVHMMIKSDDAPTLERALHKVFHKRRVNKTNPRKEFFRVTIDEIVKAVHAHHGEVEYKADAEALEYLQSQNMTDDEVEEVEEVFEKVQKITGVTADID